MSAHFELEDDEAVALMQCASAGAVAAQVLLGANARQMQPIFEKIQIQFAEQRTPPRPQAVNKRKWSSNAVMSQHQFFRRTAVSTQVATKQETVTFPAPTRGLILNENESYMQPAAAIVMDNWVPTMKGAKIRGGHVLWADLHGGDDPYWNNVVLMMGFEGANGSTGAPGLTDESLALHGIANSGASSTIETAQFKFGTSSYRMHASIGNSLRMTGDSADWRLSAANSDRFTIEFWVRMASVAAGRVYLSNGAAAPSFSWSVENGAVSANEILFKFSVDGTTIISLETVGASIALNTWVAIAVDKDASGKIRIYKDGVMRASSTPANSAFFDTTSVDGIGIMCYNTTSGRSDGWIDELRITKGVARYATDSGYTVTTTTFPRVGPPPREPIISAFQYVSGINHRMFFANETKVYDVTTSTPVLVKSGQLDGNYSTSQLANAAGDFLIAVNDAGDYPLRFDGTTWTTLSADQITGPAGSAVLHGKNLVHVCKYRNRWFFIELNSMNAWYLGLNSIGGALNMIPLSGAATKGGKLMYCATWSIDAGDGIDDKLVFGTDLGEIIVFTGSDPAVAANWRQEGRYDMSPPMGKNAMLSVGGDLLVACVDGILPTSGAITKDRAELELAAITRQIKPMWRDEVIDKREWAWTLCKWDIYGGIFVTWPGGVPGKRLCAVVNAATGAWARFTGWDATCFAKMRDDMFFGTQDGRIMQADRTGYDDGLPYICTMVGGWEVFQSPSQSITWKQARAAFSARAGEPFVPQLGGTTDYVIALPTPPSAAPDPGLLDLWDEGLWDVAKWDADMPSASVVRNTGWVSIGVTGFSHAPIVQVTMAQAAKPEVELISIAGTFERLAITV